jgi:hypothetical protein
MYITDQLPLLVVVFLLQILIDIVTVNFFRKKQLDGWLLWGDCEVWLQYIPH